MFKRISYRIFRLLLSILHPSLGVKEIWENSNTTMIIARAIEIPLNLIGIFFLIYMLKNYGYREVLLYWIFFFFVSFSLKDLTHARLFTRQKAWPNLISDNIFATVFWIIILDILYQNGIFDQFQNAFINVEKNPIINKRYILYFIILYLGYLPIYFLLNRIPRSIVNLLPDIQSFLRSKKLIIVIFNFICLALFVSFLFAAIHYLLFVSLDFTGFSESKINFMDFTFYSFSLLFNSPISDIKPTSFITKIFAGIESISSYLILVVFVAFLLEKYLSSKGKINRKKKFLKLRYIKRNN